MIIDELKEWRRYAALSPRFSKAFEFLQGVTPAMAVGRHDLDGDHVYALIQRYTTRPPEQCAFEAHRRYSDIQFVSSGRETILWSPLSALTMVTHPYDNEKDYSLFAAVATGTPVRLGAGQFAIFFPEDGHAPCGQWDGPSDVLKVVIKVRM